VESNYIWRDFTLQPTKDKSAKFLQALSICRCSITDSWSLQNGFPESSANRHELFFRLKFRKQEDLDKFHSLGFVTTTPPKVELGF